MTFIPFTLLFLAGGVGKRMESSIPKQYLSICQKPLALFSFDIFTSMPEIDQIIVVCEPEYNSLFQNAAKGLHVYFAPPGSRRQDSVSNGLQLIERNQLVCIHDSARPLIQSTQIRQVVEMAEKWGAAASGVPVKSTIKICDDTRRVVDTPPRAFLWEIHTPQVIHLNLLKDGFAYANSHHLTVTDDVSLIENLGMPVKIVEGSYSNIKVTIPEDLVFFEKLIEVYALL